MGKRATRIVAALQHWQLANVSDTLRKCCVRQLMNHRQPSLITHDGGVRETRERRARQAGALGNKIHLERPIF